MNALAKKAQLHYLRTQVESASPAKLILMLYDGSVRYLNRAIGSLEMGNRESFAADVVNAQKIVTELMSSLDPSKNQEVATNLERIYEYMVRQLGLALVRGDSTLALEVKSLLENLREGWQEAILKTVDEGLSGQEEQQLNLPIGQGGYSPTIQPGLMSTLNIAG